MGKGAYTNIGCAGQDIIQIAKASIDHGAIDGVARILHRNQPKEDIGGKESAAVVVVEPAPTAVIVLEAIDLLQPLTDNLG